MGILFWLAAVAVGVAVGAALGYETRDLQQQPTGWRPWLIFVGVAAVVIACSLLVLHINETAAPSALTKGIAVLSGALAFAATLFLFRRQRTRR